MDENSDVDPVGSGSRGIKSLKGKAEFNQEKKKFRRKLYFSSLNLKKVGADVC